MSTILTLQQAHRVALSAEAQQRAADDVHSTEKHCRYAAIAFFAAAIFLSLAPILQAKIFSHAIQYAIEDYIYISIAVVTGLIFLGYSFKKRFEFQRASERADQQLSSLNSDHLALYKKICAAYRGNVEQDRFVMALNEPLRINMIQKMDKQKFKNFALRVCLDQYDLNTQTCNSNLIANLKTSSHCDEALTELKDMLPEAFIRLFQT